MKAGWMKVKDNNQCSGEAGLMYSYCNEVTQNLIWKDISVQHNVHKYTRYCKANEDSLHSGPTLKSGLKHNKVDKRPHSRDSALIFHTSLPWQLHSARLSNLMYHDLFLLRSEETWQKILLLLLAKKKVALRRDLYAVMDAHAQHSYHYQHLTDLVHIQACLVLSQMRLLQLAQQEQNQWRKTKWAKMVSEDMVAVVRWSFQIINFLQ